MKDDLGAYRVYGPSGNIREVIALQDTVMMIICEHDNKNKYGQVLRLSVFQDLWQPGEVGLDRDNWRRFAIMELKCPEFKS